MEAKIKTTSVIERAILFDMVGDTQTKFIKYLFKIKINRSRGKSHIITLYWISVIVDLEGTALSLVI